MVSLRFPFFSSSPNLPPKQPYRRNASPSRPFSLSAAAAAGVGLGLGLSLYLKSTGAGATGPRLNNPWASLSLADGLAETATLEPKTGASFPSVIDGSMRLLGVGVRRKSVFGLKNIDVYAFGVYADRNDVKKLSEKYGMLCDSELKQNKELIADVLDQDLGMTVRLQIVYGRLSIRSVRSAFEESVGNRLLKFSGSDNKELLQRFTSLFKDEYKLPRGSIIDLSREHGFVLKTTLDGKELGSIQSKLLCQSIFDLYIGEDPFDKHAKEDFELGLTSLLKE